MMRRGARGRGERTPLYERPSRGRPSDTENEMYARMQYNIWASIRGWLYAMGIGMAILSILLIALWAWWLIFWDNDYHDIKDDIHTLKKECCDEEYNATKDMCNDTKANVDFSCFNDTLCEAFTKQNTTLGCLADVSGQVPQDNEIFVYDQGNGTWTSKPAEEACPALCTNGTNGGDGNNGTNGGAGNDGLDCWDINGNGLCDLQVEDVNNDGVCNQTDCIGDPGTDGINGTSATIDECEKPFGQLCLVNGTTPADNVPFVLNLTSSNTWFQMMGSSCMVKANNAVNVSMMGCKFIVIANDSYKIEVDGSFSTLVTPGTEVWVGISLDGADPLITNSFSVHSGVQHMISFRVALYLTAGTQVSVAFYSLTDPDVIAIERLQFTAVGELLCGFDVTGAQGNTGNTGPQGNDGYHCWDLNENYFCDLGTEDFNNDGVCNVSDCVFNVVPLCELPGMDCGNVSQIPSGSLVLYNNASSEWEATNLCVAMEGFASLDCLSDVTITGPVQANHVIRADPFNSSEFINAPLGFCDLHDVVCIINSKRSMDERIPIGVNYFSYNGSTFEPRPITYADIEDPLGNDLCSSLDQVEIDCLVNVDIPVAINNSFVVGNGTHLIMGQVDYSDLTGNLCDQLATESFGCFDDVDVPIATNNSVLMGNGTHLLMGQVDYDDLSGDICDQLSAESIGCFADVDLTGAVDNDTLIFQAGTFVVGTPNSGSLTCSSIDNVASNYVSPENIILMYTFKELEGTKTADVSGFGSPVNLGEGTAGSPSPSFWQYPGGIRVDVSPTNSHVWRSGAASANKVTNAIKASGKYSVEVWMKPTDTTQDSPSDPAHFFVIGKNGGDDCFSNDQIIAIGQGSNEFIWRLPNGGSCNTKIYNNAFLENHIALQFVVTYDGSAVVIYKNGKKVYSGTQSSSISSWTSNYEISLFNNPWLSNGDQEEWDGILKRVVVWDKALSQAEVIQTFKRGPDWPEACTCDCS